MKKRLLGTIIFLLCMTLFIPLAHAEEVRVTVTAAPTELSETGTVRFTFSISNFSDYELSDIVILYNGVSYDDLRETVIPPNQSVQDYNLDLTVSESQLGSPITFSITCVRNGEPITQDAAITIARSSDPVISLTRTADKQMAKQGDAIKLTYKFSNETKFDMTDIMLIDEDISDTPIRQDSLRAGDSFSLDRQYTMGAESVVSAPVVTYTVNGKTKSFSGVESLTLQSLLVRLNMKIDAGVPTAAGVNFTIEIKNTGNQDVKNILITDERNNAVNTEPFSLKSGESTTFSCLVVPIMTEPLRNVKFLLKGTDSLDQPYTLESAKTYEVYPFVDNSQINVTARAETVTPWTSDGGKVVARVIINNLSSVALTNVAVSETSIGVLKVFDTLPAGETSFDQEILLGSPRNLQFAVKGTDPTGANRELATCVLPVAYGTEAPGAETATPIPEINNTGTGAFGFLSSTISRILVVLGILMVIAFIVLIVLTVMERGHGSLFVRYDSGDNGNQDDFDRIFDEYPRRDYHDDAEEVRSYTQRMRSQTTRRGAAPKPPVYGRGQKEPGAQAAIPLPPATTPDPQQPMVRMEYEEDYGNGAYPADYDEPAAPGSRRQHAQDRRLEDGINTRAESSAGTQRAGHPHRQAANARVYGPDAGGRNTQPQQSPDIDEQEELPPYRKQTDGAGGADGQLRTPKVIIGKAQPAVRAQSRNVVRHVHVEPKK